MLANAGHRAVRVRYRAAGVGARSRRRRRADFPAGASGPLAARLEDVQKFSPGDRRQIVVLRLMRYTLASDDA
jgi:hypothetical protein